MANTTTEYPATYEATPSFNNTEWCDGVSAYKTVVFAMGIVNYVVFGVNVWLLLSLIIYGTKARRWRNKPGTSSLNSGAVYVVCVLATVLNIFNVSLSQCLYLVPRLEIQDFPCNEIIEATETTYFVSVFVRMLFLWLMQRRIYNHPCVKERVAVCMDRLSKWFILVLTLVILAVICIFLLDRDQYGTCEQGCVATEKEVAYVQLLTSSGTIAVVAVQAIILGLSLYPAFRARFTTSNEVEALATEVHLNHTSSCWEVVCLNSSKTPDSPIQLAVKRTFISSIVMVGCEILATITDVFIIPIDAPTVLHFCAYDLSGLFNAFAMLAVFGFAGRVLTLCCPTCPERIKRTISGGRGRDTARYT